MNSFLRSSYLKIYDSFSNLHEIIVDNENDIIKNDNHSDIEITVLDDDIYEFENQEEEEEDEEEEEIEIIVGSTLDRLDTVMENIINEILKEEEESKDNKNFGNVQTISSNFLDSTSEMYFDTNIFPDETEFDTYLYPNLQKKSEYFIEKEKMFSDYRGTDQVMIFGANLKDKEKMKFIFYGLNKFENFFKNRMNYLNRKKRSESKKSNYKYVNNNSNNNNDKSLINSKISDTFDKFRFWFDISLPLDDRDLIFELIRIFKDYLDVHTLTIEDMLNSNSREKVEFYKNYLYLVISDVVMIDYIETKVNINIIHLGDHIITIHSHDISFIFDVLYNVKHILRFKTDEVTCDWIVYSFFDNIVDKYFSLVTELDKNIDQLNSDISSVTATVDVELMFHRISMMRMECTDLRKNLISKNKLLIYNNQNIINFINPKTKIYFRDIKDHIRVLIRKLELDRLNIENATKNYIDIVNIQKEKAEHQLNKLMIRFAGLGSIFLPISFICSLYGVNIVVPGQGAGFGILWFCLLVVLLIIWGLSLIYIFREKGWL